jgi:hypothetical protein
MRYQQSNRELWASFFAVLMITLVYLYAMSQVGGVPAASGLFGHGIGILGFILMLMTEILYSWRKRSRSARWGKMSTWLRFHIFTGLVGPYMVLLHTSWKFNGLAGIVLLLTIIIVFSGIVGRYIFTAIPRTADGAEIEQFELEQQIAFVEDALRKWQESQPEITQVLSQALREPQKISETSPMAVLGRAFSEIGYQVRYWQVKHKFKSSYRSRLAELERLFKRKRTLQRQVATLTMARRLLSLWHMIHIPIGVALFSTAFVHMIGAIYYATLLQ